MTIKQLNNPLNKRAATTPTPLKHKPTPASRPMKHISRSIPGSMKRTATPALIKTDKLEKSGIEYLLKILGINGMTG